jgi:hypothetical protein
MLCLNLHRDVTIFVEHAAGRAAFRWPDLPRREGDAAPIRIAGRVVGWMMLVRRHCHLALAFDAPDCAITTDRTTPERAALARRHLAAGRRTA